MTMSVYKTFNLIIIGTFVLFLLINLSHCSRQKNNRRMNIFGEKEAKLKLSKEEKFAEKAPQKLKDKVKVQYVMVFDDSQEDVDGIIDEMVDEFGTDVDEDLKQVKKVNRNKVGKFRSITVDVKNEKALRKLRKVKGVKYIEQDGIVQALATRCTNVYIGDKETYGLDLVDLDYADESGTYEQDGWYWHDVNGGEGVKVYILDTGVRASHWDLGGRVSTGVTLCSGLGCDVKADGTHDGQGHGTHVAGTISGQLYGVAKRATLVPVKILADDGFGTLSDFIQAIYWVASQQTTSGTSVINASLGAGLSWAVNEAVRAVVEETGIPMIVAAGNEDMDACHSSPASAPAAITVGSVTPTMDRSSFSNWGSCVDIFAPGSDIKSAGIGSDTESAIMSGTSMAAPHVAGAAAVFLGQNAGSTPNQLYDWLMSNAVTGSITTPGSGSPNKLLQVPCSMNW